MATFLTRKPDGELATTSAPERLGSAIANRIAVNATGRSIE
jgi:hypothetical protein